MGVIFKVSGSHDWTLGEDQIGIWASQFPDLDVERELLKMQAWCEANPSRRKKPTGMKRFIVTWLCKADGDRVQQARREDRTQRARQLTYVPFECPHSPRCSNRTACWVISQRTPA